MPRVSTAPRSAPFGWREVRAMFGALPKLTGRAEQRVTYRSLAATARFTPECQPPLEFFTASDGARLAARRYACGGSAHVVLVHGSACFGDQLHPLANHLAQHLDATVHTLDLRGHGRSDPSTDDPNVFARDLGDYVKALKRAEPGVPVFIGGHSAGGGLVLKALSEGWLDGVAGAMLLAPFVRLSGPTVRPMFGGWLARFRHGRFAAIAMANLLGSRRFNTLTVAHFNREACLHDPRFAQEWSFADVCGFGPGAFAPDRSPLPSVPLLLVAGENDECFDAAAYGKALAETGAQITVLAKLGHWDILSANASLAACEGWMRLHLAANPTPYQDRNQGRYKYA